MPSYAVPRGSMWSLVRPATRHTWGDSPLSLPRESSSQNMIHAKNLMVLCMGQCLPVKACNRCKVASKQAQKRTFIKQARTLARPPNARSFTTLPTDTHPRAQADTCILTSAQRHSSGHTLRPARAQARAFTQTGKGRYQFVCGGKQLGGKSRACVYLGHDVVLNVGRAGGCVATSSIGWCWRYHQRLPLGWIFDLVRTVGWYKSSVVLVPSPLAQAIFPTLLMWKKTVGEPSQGFRRRIAPEQLVKSPDLYRWSTPSIGTVGA